MARCRSRTSRTGTLASTTPWQTRCLLLQASTRALLQTLQLSFHLQGCSVRSQMLMLQGMLLTHPAGCHLQMMDRLGESAKLETPEDTSITTLFIGSITPSMSEEEIVEPFLPFGEVRSGWPTSQFSGSVCLLPNLGSHMCWTPEDWISVTDCEGFGCADPVGAEAGGAALHVRDVCGAQLCGEGGGGPRRPAVHPGAALPPAVGPPAGRAHRALHLHAAAAGMCHRHPAATQQLPPSDAQASSIALALQPSVTMPS